MLLLFPHFQHVVRTYDGPQSCLYSAKQEKLCMMHTYKHTSSSPHIYRAVTFEPVIADGGQARTTKQKAKTSFILISSPVKQTTRTAKSGLYSGEPSFITRSELPEIVRCILHDIRDRANADGEDSFSLPSLAKFQAEIASNRKVKRRDTITAKHLPPTPAIVSDEVSGVKSRMPCVQHPLSELPSEY